MPRESAGVSADVYRRSRMQRERIIKELRERGYRITRQRQVLIDIILENEYSCCKEIYYKAVQKDENIGSATVYRMLKTLEEIGSIARNNMYKISCGAGNGCDHKCVVELDDDTSIELTPMQWKQVVKCGLDACGYTKNQEIRRVNISAHEPQNV